eukprot:CAMPEP_0198140956 /NCGR_PEP_ID=MMETSP1443-20131203/4037_1 /TAXON_ID=186043 /ORGANISM="Entomoneis sp., Strain CCMP2396" /LENGTH=357 /DNA_ID=CAMNT_0043803543 /DNA_START=92 /DNA_END=1162 /DNA_ORIENTATION=+
MSSKPAEAAKIPQELCALPTRFLRASDPSLYDVATFQRKNVEFDATTGKPIISSEEEHVNIVQCENLDNQKYTVTWSDGRISEFSKIWVKNQYKNLMRMETSTDRVYWRNLTESDLRSSSEMSIDFSQILTQEGTDHAIRALYRFGILLVQNTPVLDNGAGVAALGAAVGGGKIKNQTSLWTTYKDGQEIIQLDHGTDGPMRTLYGTVWSTSFAGQADGASVADSAYGQEALPLHTDLTYLSSPPGLQIFTMVHPAKYGGESVFGDGFAMADLLRRTNPQAFETLCNTSRCYRCIDKDSGWHLEATGPVISKSLNGNEILAIRHNDLDRLPVLPPPTVKVDKFNEFYAQLAEAHQAW